MSALTEARNTVTREVNYVQLTAAGAIYAGGMVAVKEVDGKAYAATASSGFTVRGIATGDTAPGGAVVVEAGTFMFNNSTGAGEIKTGHLGKTCYVVDDQTVTIVAGALAAGKVVEVVEDGVWVTIN